MLVTMAKKLHKNTVIKLIAVLFSVGLLAWYLYGVRASTSKRDTTTPAQNVQTTKRDKQTPGTLSLNKDAVPKDWKVDQNDPAQITLANESTKCSISVDKTDDKNVKESAMDAFIQKRKEEVMAGIKAKGYEVAQLPASILNTSSKDNEQNITTFDLSLTGPKAFVQSYGYILKDGYYVEIQRSCDKQSDLTSTDPALSAIAINT